jgi:hypothetical protein
MGTQRDIVLEGRVEGDEVIVDVTETRRRPDRRWVSVTVKCPGCDKVQTRSVRPTRMQLSKPRFCSESCYAVTGVGSAATNPASVQPAAPASPRRDVTRATARSLSLGLFHTPWSRLGGAGANNEAASAAGAPLCRFCFPCIIVVNLWFAPRE